MDKKEDSLDKELRGLDVHEPSMRFTQNVVERVKTETSLIPPERNRLGWIPKLCVAGFALGFCILMVVFSTNPSETNFQVSPQSVRLIQTVLTVSVGVLLFLGVDRMFRSLWIRR